MLIRRAIGVVIMGSPCAADSLPCCIWQLKVLVFWAMERYNGSNEFGQVGAVRGDSVKVFVSVGSQNLG